MKHLLEMQKEFEQEINKFKEVPLAQRELIKQYTGKDSKLIFLGRRIPEIRSILKKDLSVFSIPLEQQFKVFEQNWLTAKTFEQKALSLFWLEGLPEKDLLKYAKNILRWADQIDNWAHSDSLCGVFAVAFEKNRALALPVYKKWNSHKNPWLRRCSMVGLFFYSRFRDEHPSFALAKSMVQPHLKASEYYVQKGVGWTLREMYNVYPIETIKFLNDNLAVISPVAWVAATEKLKKPIKDKMLKKRRELKLLAK